MAEGSKVRLVRCPKCDNLLREVPNVPVYQCGGCGAVLQVQMKLTGIDGSSEKSYEERVKLGSEKSESDREIDGVEVRRERGERGENLNSSSSSRTSENMGNWRRDRGTVDQESDFGGKFRHPSKAPLDSNSSEDDQKVDILKGIGETIPQMGILNSSERSDQIPNFRVPERDGVMGYRRTQRTVGEIARFSNPPYPDEGPSNHQPPSSNYGYGELIKNQNNLGVPERIEYLEKDRAELLRQLEELKSKLSRSCEVSGKPNESVPVDGRTVRQDPYYGGRHEDWLPESSSGSDRAHVQPSLPDKYVRTPSYFGQRRELVPVMSRNDMDSHKFYAPMPKPNEILGYGDPFEPQLHGRDPNNLPRHYPQRPSHDYYFGQYMEMDPHPFSTHPNNDFFHHPSCSCFHCYNKQWQVPKQVPPAVIGNRRFRDAPTNPMFYHVENPGTVGPRGYNPRGANLNPLPLHTREPYPLSRRSNDLDSGFRSFGQGRLEREVQTKRNPRRCTPIAGGSPFITCYSCFELLRLPRLFLLINKNQRKLQCGACSTVMLISIESKKLLVSAPSEVKESPLEVNGGPVEVIKEGPLQSNGHAMRYSVNSSHSDDYGNSGYSYESMDSEHAIDHNFSLRDSEKVQETPSSPSSATECEESPDSVIARMALPKSAEVPVKENITRPLPGSPLLEHFEYSSYQREVSRVDKGNESKRMDPEEVTLTEASSKQNSVKDTSTATEMEVSFSEYSNTGISQDSEELSREEDRSRFGKGGGSFFGGSIKKSLRDTFGSNQMEENDIANVSINGYPVPDRLIKKAEKRAGKIHPGEYWYDFRAGFWGVMGHPCMGVIPPFIDEFDYPMPKNCAGGNTGVCVNGRELHQKDLNLLANRGLPTTRNKSYLIEISGSVLDETTGEELDSLGKLAPTIERLKHGFGMRAPRIVA